jgi:hypothetical protein
MTDLDCSFVHRIPERIILAEEARIRIALQNGGYRKAGSVPLREAAIGSLIENLHDDANDLSIQNYTLDYQMDFDGNLAVVLHFGHVADMVLFRFAI